jgi:hypothetical protein
MQRVARRRREPQLLAAKRVPKADNVGLGCDKNIFVDAGPRVPWTKDDSGKPLAVSLHKPFPVDPGRTKLSNALHNVKEGMDGSATEIDSSRIVAIV